MARSRRQVNRDEARPGEVNGPMARSRRSAKVRSGEVSSAPMEPSRRQASAGSFGTNFLVSAQEDAERSASGYSWIIMRAVVPILAIAAAAFYKLLTPS